MSKHTKESQLLEKLIHRFESLDLRIEHFIERVIRLIEECLSRKRRHRPVKLVVHFDKPVPKER